MKLQFALLAMNISFSICSFAQIVDDSIMIDDHYRSFHFRQPSVSGKNASLIFILHGSGGDGMKMMANTTKLQEAVANENVFLVFPDGYKKYWNECRKAAPAEANMLNIDEISFFSSMIGYFKKNYAIDPKKVFVVGTSGGGHMAYKLALESPENFRAFTAVVANLPDTNNIDCVGKNIPVSIMIINGTADQTNPYGGGPVVLGNNFSMGDVRSTDRTFNYWASLAGYKGQPKKENLPDTDPSDGKTIERYTFKQKGKPEVTLLKVINGVHGYPNDIDVHIEAWQFFKRQMSN